MPRTVERGRPAAPGLAAGPLVRLDRSGGRARSRAAIPNASALTSKPRSRRRSPLRRPLAAEVEGDAADILDFQIAMLEDSGLSEPALRPDRARGRRRDRVVRGDRGADRRLRGDGRRIFPRPRRRSRRPPRPRRCAISPAKARRGLPAGAVLAGEDVTPSRFLSVDWSRGGGIALFAGSPSSHVAMLARSRGVPMVVGLGAVDLDGHASAIVDGDDGRVVLSPNEHDLREFEAARAAGASLRASSSSSLRRGRRARPTACPSPS